MTANITWTPGGGEGAQIVQYKKTTEVGWTNYSTRTSSANSESIIGLVDNFIYNIRIVNNCSGGAGSTVTNSAIKITCPTVAVSATYDTAVVNFSHLGGSINRYKLELFDETAASVGLVTLEAPFDSNVNYTFEDLTPDSNYNLKVIPSANTFSKTDCSAITFGTLQAPTCGIITAVSVTMN